MSVVADKVKKIIIDQLGVQEVRVDDFDEGVDHFVFVSSLW